MRYCILVPANALVLAEELYQVGAFPTHFKDAEGSDWYGCSVPDPSVDLNELENLGCLVYVESDWSNREAIYAEAGLTKTDNPLD